MLINQERYNASSYHTRGKFSMPRPSTQGRSGICGGSETIIIIFTVLTSFTFLHLKMWFCHYFETKAFLPNQEYTIPFKALLIHSP